MRTLDKNINPANLVFRSDVSNYKVTKLKLIDFSEY